MKKKTKIVVEIIEVDDAVAGDALATAMRSLNSLDKKYESVVTTEPHDDARGIYGEITYNDEFKNNSHRQIFNKTLKNLIYLAVFPNEKAVIHIREGVVT
jgi:hypothetical protein